MVRPWEAPPVVKLQCIVVRPKEKPPFRLRPLLGCLVSLVVFLLAASQPNQDQAAVPIPYRSPSPACPQVSSTRARRGAQVVLHRERPC